MKTILVPTDFSKNAENALVYAINLTKKMPAKIILLHSFHIDYTSGYVPPNLIEKDVAEAQANSNTQLKALYNKVSHHAKHPIECLSSQNFAIDAVLSAINEKNVDLVIMGTQGANGKLGRQIFGTNSSKVIEKATCPVITVPENEEHTDVKAITYATEYLDSDIASLQSITDIARLFDAKINIIHVSLFDDESEQKIMESFKLKVLKHISYKNISFKILVGNNVGQRIEGYLEEEKNIDLLVMSAHHRSLIDKLFGKSITKVMAYYLKIPLMVFHHKRTALDDASDHTITKLIT